MVSQCALSRLFVKLSIDTQTLADMVGGSDILKRLENAAAAASTSTSASSESATKATDDDHEDGNDDEDE